MYLVVTYHDFTVPMWGSEVANCKTQRYKLWRFNKRGDVYHGHDAMTMSPHHTTPHHTTPHHTTPHHTTPHHTTPPLSTRGRRSVQFVCVLKGTLDAPALKHVTSLGECRHPCGALVHIYYATSFVWQREVGRRSCRRYVGTKKYEIPYVITRTRLVV